jgi:LmbE family N-acetylglucosaminyl deacetylase
MPRATEIEPGDGRCVLVVVAHADDLALSLGGTIIRWSDAGWRVIAVRVTDDRWDSVGLTEAATIEANRAEFQWAAETLGIAEIVDFGYPTDTLGDASEVTLRERIIRQVRTHRPYALVTFDPYAMYGEDNQDHMLVAAAVDESFWTSQFDLHHPEHLAEGLRPHGCFERWYFGRRVIDVTDVIDIGDVFDRKVEAALCHSTMLTNMVNQFRLQGRTGGWELPAVDAALSSGDLRPVIDPMLRRRAEASGQGRGVALAEEFRVVRFGGLDFLLDNAVRLPR